MGIDVYLHWNGMTEEEKEAQYMGFSIHHGHVGYLREAYHGEPYAIKVLIPGDWKPQPEEGFSIPAAVLRQRLPSVIKASIRRTEQLYSEKVSESDPSVQSFIKFVELAEEKEAAGLEPRIVVSF